MEKRREKKQLLLFSKGAAFFLAVFGIRALDKTVF